MDLIDYYQSNYWLWKWPCWLMEIKLNANYGWLERYFIMPYLAQVQNEESELEGAKMMELITPFDHDDD